MEEITITKKQLKDAVVNAMTDVVDEFDDKELALFVSLSGAFMGRKLEERLFGEEPDDDKADSEKEDK